MRVDENVDRIADLVTYRERSRRLDQKKVMMYRADFKVNTAIECIDLYRWSSE